MSSISLIGGPRFALSRWTLALTLVSALGTTSLYAQSYDVLIRGGRSRWHWQPLVLRRRRGQRRGNCRHRQARRCASRAHY